MISDIRLGERGGGELRLVIDVDDAIAPAISVLPDPYRVVLDLPAADWHSEQGQGAGKGFIAGYRYGLFSPTQSRLVLDLTEPAVVRRAFLLQPSGRFSYRYVVDLAAADRAAFLAAAKASRPMESLSPPVTRQAEAAGPKESRKPHIVIDPGHGGIDPGTRSHAGHQEKAIVLAVAQEVARQLAATGRYGVTLTRDSDIFIPHRRRIEIARVNEADLFISIHADWIKNDAMTGGTVYTLSEKASDAEAAALAARENKADIIAGVDLNGENDEVRDILISLAQRETMNYSSRFANMLVEALGGKNLIPARPHRFAGFIVLKAPDVPSVLIETGYLSNRDDARRLASRDGQRQIAAAVVRAANRYFDERLAQRF
ncbi:MAG: N-acetylmuramoyl-L-alanine amidase [Pseudomonadota bacterium]